MAPRYALLDCEDAEKWRGHEKIWFEAAGPGAQWEHFRCWAHELPPLDALDRFTGVFITGGHYSAYQDLPWINELAAWLHDAAQQYPGVKFAGICFGCQILARALGGEVGRNPSHRFVLKVEELRLSPELASDPTYCQALADVHPSPAAAPAAVPPASTSDTNSSSSNGSGRSSANGSSGSTVRLIQSHGDQVLRLPEGARPLAESETARFEVWAWGRHVLAIQGHPELTPEVVMEKIYPAITAAGRLTQEESAASAASLTGVCPDSGLVLAVLQRFMERGLQGPAAGNGPAEAEAGAGPEAPAEGDESRLEQLNSGGSLPPAAEGSPVPGSSVASALSSAATTSAVTGSAPELAAVVGAGAAAEAAAGPAAVEQHGQAGGGITSSGAAELEPSLSQLLGALSLGVTAELGRVPSELRLLQDVDATAAAHYEHMAKVVAQANKGLQAVREQQSALGPALEAIESLEAQVCQLEGVMAHMEATAVRLQHALSALERNQ